MTCVRIETPRAGTRVVRPVVRGRRSQNVSLDTSGLPTDGTFSLPLRKRRVKRIPPERGASAISDPLFARRARTLPCRGRIAFGRFARQDERFASRGECSV